jgi:hypothetical protein
VLTAHICLAQLPKQPTDTNHPGSANYNFTSKQTSAQIDGRKVDIFIPVEARSRGLKVPVIIFGHGQAIDVAGYELTFKHLAQKGIAVIHPMFDNGFFDQDWRRMASDFNSLSQKALSQYADVIDDQKIIYAGHSKGAGGCLLGFAKQSEYHKYLHLRCRYCYFWYRWPESFGDSQLVEICRYISKTNVSNRGVFFSRL